MSLEYRAAPARPLRVRVARPLAIWSSSLLALTLALACERPPETTGAPEAAAAAPVGPDSSDISEATPERAPAAEPGDADADADAEDVADADVPRTRGSVVLVTLGSFPDDLIADIERSLAEEFAVEVRRHPEVVPLPEETYYPPRKRYRADKLLDFLERLPAASEPDTKILGLTEVDISTTKEPHEDWGIFGLGHMPGRAAVISSKRLKRRAKDRAHLTRRVRITALHELGHTFGLPHCPEERCLMQDAEGSIKNTDTASGALEPGCRAKLERRAPLRAR